MAARQAGVSPGVPKDRGAEEDARRSEDVGRVGDGRSLARERSWQAMEHAVERGRVEWPVDGEWLADVGLNGRDVQALQPPGCMTEDVHVSMDAVLEVAARNSTEPVDDRSSRVP